MREKEFETVEESGQDILTYIQMLWKHKAVIIVLTVLAALLMFAKTTYLTADTYTSYGILHVSNKKEESDPDTSIKKTDLDTSKSLSTTYIEILKTRAFLRDISNAVDGKYSGTQIGSMISISSVNDTELLKITVTAGNAEDAYQIAQAFMAQAPAKLISVYKSGEIEVVDPPVKPTIADNKGIARNTAIGFVLGFVLGAVYAFIYEFFDRKIHKSDDVAKRYGVSILGETSLDPHRSSKRKKEKELPEELQNVLNSKSDFDTVETYKAIRTNIMFSMPKKELGRVIIVTSAAPGEGKTTTAINLAITFAQTGAKVMLIDCDLRHSRVHRYLQLERDEGVTNVVCGYTDLEKAIRKNVRDNLDCLTAGAIPPNPAELLQSDEFQNMVDTLRHEYDYIFLDTPPVTVVTDAAILTKHCSGVVLVARSELTTYDMLDSAVEDIKNADAKILGIIVHGCSNKYKKYGYYRSKKYGNKYKYKYDYRYADDVKK